VFLIVKFLQFHEHILSNVQTGEYTYVGILNAVDKGTHIWGRRFGKCGVSIWYSEAS